MSQTEHRKIGFIGVGNMAQAMIQTWTESGAVPANQIYGVNRTPGKLKKVSEQFGIVACDTIEELIEACELVILAVKPQDLVPALESISSTFGAHHVVMSLAAGVSVARLKRLLPNVKQWVRVMPNTPVRIRQGVSGYYLAGDASHLRPMMERLLKPLGAVIGVDDEDHFASLSVACSAGVGFVLELMQYWQEWLEEHDFDPEQARQMTVKTFLGASLLADQAPQMPVMDLQARVTSKKGITAAGLDSMRELEIERLLRYSFEKAAMRDKELGEEQQSR
ncbi:MAG: pyrroline-5-carboxylate reductase family protein [Bdellovibrionales bacterium]